MPEASGKTRLAVEVAAQMRASSATASWYVDLAPITDPDLVPVTVGARARACPTSRAALRQTACCGSSATRQMLMVLDNCEHLLDATRSADHRAVWAAARG